MRERLGHALFHPGTALAGLLAFLQLGRAEDPAFTVRVMVVSALWPGASAQQMQDLVADPLEKRISEVEYFYKVETTARPGRVDMLVEFQDYTPVRRRCRISSTRCASACWTRRPACRPGCRGPSSTTTSPMSISRSMP